MEIKIIKANDWNWYKDLIGQVLLVKNKDKYSIGVQVYRPDGIENAPDVV